MNSVLSVIVAVTAVLAGARCAGNGTGLDEFGNPLTGPGAAPAPTLRAIQGQVFTPICTQCHTGAAAPLGLALDRGVARGALVRVPSVQLPALLRVNPGKPDSSYLVWKIEGRPEMLGGRMPLALAPLSADWIAAIRAWIEAGAPDN